MPARFPFARRAPAGAERPPASVSGASAEVSPPRRVAPWTVGPGNQDDEWLYRNRRRDLACAHGPTTLKRPTVRAAPLAAPSTSSPVTAVAPAAGRGPVTRDFSAVPAHRAAPSVDPLRVPAAARAERAVQRPDARPPVGSLEAARRVSAPLPKEIGVLTEGMIGQPARHTAVRSGTNLYQVAWAAGGLARQALRLSG